MLLNSFRSKISEFWVNLDQALQIEHDITKIEGWMYWNIRFYVVSKSSGFRSRYRRIMSCSDEKDRTAYYNDNLYHSKWKETLPLIGTVLGTICCTAKYNRRD